MQTQEDKFQIVGSQSGRIVYARQEILRSQIEEIQGEIVAEDDYQMDLVVRRARKDPKFFIAGAIVHTSNLSHTGHISIRHFLATRQVLGEALRRVDDDAY